LLATLLTEIKDKKKQKSKKIDRKELGN
jgi:hypothetical protein